MASKLPPITIIIPTLDSKTLYPTIRSLRNQTYPGSKIHILVVNNGSSKISLPGTKIIYPRRNLGFSRAVNLAIANTSTDFLLICNDDVHAPPSTIAKLVSYLSKHPEAGIVGANNGYSINLFNGSIHPSNKLHPDWISGAFLLTKKSILQQIGLLKERYFMYFEDIHLATQARRHGYSVVSLQNVVIHHKESSTTNRYPVKKMLYWTSSKILFYLSAFPYSYVKTQNDSKI